MIFDESTVLVLGAGASNPYGFPLGDDLKQRIISLCSSTANSECKQLLEAGYPEEEIRDFHTDLVRSIHPILDTFLEDRPSHRSIGAFAIAHVLMRLETEETLYPHKNWYQMLFRELNLKETDRKPEVSGIVTFNYDRSLEHYLTETAKRTFESQPRKAALTKLSRIPILHVHGVMGSYPDMPYRPQRTTDDIKRGASGIRMIHDADLENTEEFVTARKLIGSAAHVFFLGFGYDARNLRRLGILDWNNSAIVHGTGYQLSPLRSREIRAMFGNGIYLTATNFKIEDCLAHLYEKRAGSSIESQQT